MKTIILCGGTGTRLREETEFRPKPMVMVGDRPLLWHLMKYYAHFGFNDFVLALGYKADVIREYFECDDNDFIITYADTGIDTPIGERILLCQQYIPSSDNDIAVTYGDGLSNVDLGALISFHKQQYTIGTITGVHPRSKYGLVTSNKDNIITHFVEKPVLVDWVNGGFMFFKRDFFRYLGEGEMEHEGLQRLIKIKELSLFKHESFWYSVDTFKELEVLNDLWRTGNHPWKVWS